MIGVICRKEEQNIVQEFFELFKTPWEYYSEDRYYDVVLCCGETRRALNASLVVIYGSGKVTYDSFLGIEPESKTGKITLQWKGFLFPVYVNFAIFKNNGAPALISTHRGEKIALEIVDGHQRIVRVGYDLFKEILFLLSFGQLPEHSSVPTIDIHISILRDLMIEAGVAFVEIPPVPHGFDFITCLTHDIDFYGIRNHFFDHTMFGFVHRAVFQSIAGVLNRRISWKKLCANLKSVLLLPAVYLRIAKDFWLPFDRYLELEQGLKSTYFLLPFKGMSGRDNDGRAWKKRASNYDIMDLRPDIVTLLSTGCEIGLHGINAWCSQREAKREFKRLVSATKKPVAGVRTHWLYFAKESCQFLENAGFRYDSTCGFNETIGFRAGTAQVFRPIASKQLVELPLLIQDTAMFFPNRMNISENEAFVLCKKIMDCVSDFGGVFVVNWHDRSLAPERFWDKFYENLLMEIRTRRVWFGTCREITRWFELRRLVRFFRVESYDRALKIDLEKPTDIDGPELKLELYGDWDRNSILISSEDTLSKLEISKKSEMDIRIKQNTN
jgi:peptidoglycan/xylan/chitin deacetylase (PgdA/CDA1 family)